MMSSTGSTAIRALLTTRELGYKSGEAFALTNLGHAWVGLGDLVQATDNYQEALALQQELGQSNLTMGTHSPV